MIRILNSLALPLAAAFAATVPGQAFVYPDFSNTPNLALLGNATQVGATLRLTANASNQSGWVWRQLPLGIQFGFSTEFSFRITPPAIGQRAEGLVFVVHADANGVATTGGTAWGLGYGVGASGSLGIRNSIAIEIDSYRDLFLADTSDNELSIHTRGSLGNLENEWSSIARVTPSVTLADGAIHRLEIRYTLPGTLEVFVDGAATPAISTAYNHITGGTYLTGLVAPGANWANGDAYAGFAATTGAGTLTQHVELLSWAWTSGSPLPPCYHGTLGADTLSVAGQLGGALRTVRLAIGQPFSIDLAAPLFFGPGAPYVLFVSMLPQPGAFGTQLGFGEMCFPVLPAGPTELVLADTFGIFPAALPALPAPHAIQFPAGTVSFPLDFTLQAVTLHSLSPLALGVSNAIDVEFRPGPTPTIQLVAPFSAMVGQTITVTGQDFVPGLTVNIDSAPVVLASTTPTQLTFANPGGVVCGATLAVVNPGGQSATTPFNPQPTVTGTLLGSGSAAGNQIFVVQGTGFAPGTTVTIGGSPATVLGTTPTNVSVRTPPGVPGVQPVVLTTPGGCTATTTYTYF